MEKNEEIISELKSINKKIENFTKPSKSAWLNFLNGFCHTVGTFLGTGVIILILYYVFSRFNITKSVSSWLENSLSQINWAKIVTPQILKLEEAEQRILQNN